MQLFEELWQSPFAQFAFGGAASAVTILLKDALWEKWTSRRKRFLDAALTGLGTTSLLWISWRAFPDHYLIEDSIAYGVAVAFLGVTRAARVIAKKMGIELPVEIEGENETK